MAKEVVRAARAMLVDLGVVVLLLAVGVAGFGPAFGGTGYLRAGLGGVVLGAVIGWVGMRFRWGILTVVAITIGSYFVFGGALAVPSTAIAHVVPSITSLHNLLVGVVQAWKQLLTVPLPAGTVEATLIVPYLSALVCCTIATSLALRLNNPVWALAPALALLIVAIAFGSDRAAFPLVQGLGFAVLSIAWYAWRRASRRTSLVEADASDVSDPGAQRQLRLRRVVSGAAVLAVAVAVAVLSQTVIAPAQARQVLRTSVVPPLDIQNYASPLVSFRKYVKEGASGKDELFSITGLPTGAMIRLATLDYYDGTVYAVATDGGSGAGSFSPVSGGEAASPDAYLTGTTTRSAARLTVKVDSLTGVWMPDVGYPTSVSFAGPRASSLTAGLNYNPVTGVALTTAALTKGDQYTIDALVPKTLDPTKDSAVASATIARVTLPQNQNVPVAVGAFASKVTASAKTPLQQLNALASALSTQGYFSHGLSGDVTSLAGHGAARIQSFLTGAEIIGDDEQYSVAMALMANQLNIPARVVMGFYPKQYDPRGTVSISGADVHAWVEVDFDKIGWVAFRPTPDENKRPDPLQNKKQPDPKAQVLQPPPAPPAALSVPSNANNKGGNSKKLVGSPLDVVVAVAKVGGVSILVLLVLFGPAFVIGILKARRRRRRLTAERAADRLSGGWDEVIDTARDLGTRVDTGVTRQESALLLADRYPQSRVLLVARSADTGVFGPADPSPSDADGYWDDVDQLVKEMTASVGRFQRLRARLSIATLIARRREHRTEPHRKAQGWRTTR